LTEISKLSVIARGVTASLYARDFFVLFYSCIYRFSSGLSPSASFQFRAIYGVPAILLSIASFLSLLNESGQRKA
jgi:hypothetical protein